jgi:hypothetical protein
MASRRPGAWLEVEAIEAWSGLPPLVKVSRIGMV